MSFIFIFMNLKADMQLSQEKEVQKYDAQA